MSDLFRISEIGLLGSGRPLGIAIRQEPTALRNRQGSHDRPPFALIEVERLGTRQGAAATVHE